MVDIVTIGYRIQTEGLAQANKEINNLHQNLVKIETGGKEASKAIVDASGKSSKAAKDASDETVKQRKHLGDLVTMQRALGSVGMASFREWEQYAKKLTRQYEILDKQTEKTYNQFSKISKASSFNPSNIDGGKVKAQYDKDMKSLKDFYSQQEAAAKQNELVRKASFDREIRLVQQAKAREQQAYTKDISDMRRYYEAQEREAKKALDAQAKLAARKVATPTTRVQVGGGSTVSNYEKELRVANAAQTALLGTLANTAGFSLGLAGFGALVVKVAEMADAYQLLQARLRYYLKDGEDVAALNDKLLTIANTSRASLQDVTNLFAKLNPALQRVGAETQNTLDVTEAFSKALYVGGANTREASAATIQFAQALASGKLAGDRQICHPTE